VFQRNAEAPARQETSNKQVESTDEDEDDQENKTGQEIFLTKHLASFSATSLRKRPEEGEALTHQPP
jgi:hypothetical protein